MKSTDQQLDEIYDLSDELMRKDCWFVLDTIIEYLTEHAWRYDVTILVGWSTATLAGKHKLEKRKEFLDKCKKLYPDKDLWKGLN
jgi:hypothetical protein